MRFRFEFWHVWDPETGEETLKINTGDRHGAHVSGVTMHPTSDDLAAIDSTMSISDRETGGRIRIWNRTSGEELLSRQPEVISVDVADEGRFIATGSIDGKIHIWNMHDGSHLRATEIVKRLGRQTASRLVFRPGTNIIASLGSGSYAYSVLLWDAQTGRYEGRMSYVRNDFFSNVECMRWSSNGQWLAAGCEGGGVMLWKADHAKPSLLHQTHSDSVASLTFTADGKNLVTSSADQTTKLISAETGDVISTLDSENIQTALVQASPSGRFLAVVTLSDRAFLWDLDLQRIHRRLDYGGDALGIDIDPFGRRLAIACERGRVVLFDMLIPGPPETLQIGPSYGEIHDVKFTPDGRHIVTANGNGTSYILRLKEWSADLGGEGDE